MNRVPIELLVGLGASAAIAVAVALVGGAIRAVPAPPDNRRRARQLLSLHATGLGAPPATDDGVRLVARAIFDLP